MPFVPFQRQPARPQPPCPRAAAAGSDIGTDINIAEPSAVTPGATVPASRRQQKEQYASQAEDFLKSV